MFNIISSYCFYESGYNHNGQLGLNHSDDVFEFTDVKFRKKFLSFCIGNSHTGAVTNTGEVFAWGFGYYGQNGNFDITMQINRPKPIEFFKENKLKARKISCGEKHTLVLLDDYRTLYSFGLALNGSLGREIEHIQDPQPGKVDLSELYPEEKIELVATSEGLNYIRTSRQRYFAWGVCNYTLCPGYNNHLILKKPTQIIFPFEPSFFHLGHTSIWIKNQAGELFAIGNNWFGKLCTNTNLGEVSANFTPVQLQNIIKIDSNTYHTIFTSESGEIYGCGRGDLGQFGYATIKRSHTEPVLLQTKSYGQLYSVTATQSGTMILTDKGIFSTGSDYEGELALGYQNQTYYEFSKASIDNTIKLERSLLMSFNPTFIFDQSEFVTKTTLPGEAIFGIVFGSIAQCILIALSIFFIIRASATCKSGQKAFKDQQNEINIPYSTYNETTK